MNKEESRIPPKELASRLQTLMFIRVAFVSILLGASLFVQIRETRTYFGYIQTIHFLLIASVYFLTFIYALLFKWTKNYRALAYLQLTADALFVCSVLLVTGGMESIFSFLFILIIITASVILYRKGGVIIASLSSFLYALTVASHYFGWIHPLGLEPIGTTPYQGAHVLYLTSVNVLAFYVVAFLTSYLSEMVKRSKVELEAKQVDFDQLELLNDGIIRSISSGVIALNNQGQIILFNPASEAIFGVRSHEAKGKRIEEILPSLSASLNEDKGKELEDQPSPGGFRDISIKGPEGEEVHLRYSISPLQLPMKGPFGSIIVLQDITEIKKIEEEMKKVEGLALVGELAAGIAHEIRNPMASISGSIQMLKEGMSGNEIQAKLMDIVLREIARLNQLVNDFLLFARPRKPSIQNFDLNRLIRETLELFQHSQHWTAKIKVSSHLDGAFFVNSDPQLVKQILWNLLRNACEAMPSGGQLHIATSLIREPAQSPMVRIHIRDTGAGFDEKAIPHLFAPFFTTKEEGSGLGLAIVKRIVEALGGQVQGANHPEGGACISVLFPLEK
ncbi:MAG: PAS domain S-box protein [Deltaproteobacteria bacterium]|nr:PAS domain S-box protein [Deltaproteobacteria bacterium]MBW1928723.1 PAS domain S-box protein [Deltaproteobacteria bacterium]MBW2024468.1 PAS domain S-box protein [Deltaproteobacteria bacterium]MBW2124095.1 PAS domain S-box protein [Deltaproteobacteria bacterium]RLB24018.1 MAG: hypothetical protein DRG76_02605 [Deltaproteobacteria bacterium]